MPSSRRSLSRLILLAPVAVGLSLLGVSLIRPTLAQQDPPDALVRIEVSGASHLERLDAAGLLVLARLAAGDEEYVLAVVSAYDQDQLRSADYVVEIVDPDAEGASYFLIPSADLKRATQTPPLFDVIHDDGQQAVVRMRPGAAPTEMRGLDAPVVKLDAAPAALAARNSGDVPAQPAYDPLVADLVAHVSSDILHSYVGGLSGEWPVEIGGDPYTLSTRYSYSGTPLTKATQYVHEHMASLGYDVSYHTYTLSGETLRNVIGEKRGTRYPDRIVILTAHLDSRAAAAPHDPAPGADDNASGSAAVMVAADLLADIDFEYTVRLVFFTGEEQGMYGSYYYAVDAYNAGDDILGVLNLDMIAWDAKGGPEIDLHSDSPSVEDDSDALADLFAAVVDTYGLDLTVQTVEAGATFSDHYRFWQQGYAAIMAIEDYFNPSEQPQEPRDWNTNYHTVGDRLSTLNLDYYREYVRGSLGTLVHLARPLRWISGTATSAATAMPISATLTASGGTGAYDTTAGADGAYVLKLPAGVYTVTASSNGYAPHSIAGVMVITGTGATLDFALVPLPTFVVTGTLTDADTGRPLTGTVRFGESVTALANSGHYSVTVFSGTYNLLAQARLYYPVTRAAIIDRDQRQDFALTAGPCLLVVDDDYDNEGNAYDDQAYYTTALEALDVDYDVWAVADDADGPPLASLRAYRGIVWLTGRDWDNTLTTADQAALAGFLDGGGKLFISGQDIGWDLARESPPPFYTNYLHATYLRDDSEYAELAGASWMSGSEITIQGGDGAGNQDWPSDIDTVGDAEGIFTYPDDDWGAIAYADDTYRVVYFAFGFEAIDNGRDRINVMERVLDYLGPCPQVSPNHVVSGTLSDAGSGQPVSGTVRFGEDVTVHTPSGHYSVTVDAGTYDVVGQAPYHYPLTRTVVVDRDQRQDFALAPTPCLLVVDDDYDSDGNAYEDQAYYTATLEAIGVDYDVWVVPDDGDGPPLDTLGLYRGVVWLTGRDWDYTLTTADQAALAGYLDSGEKLFISGQDIGWDLARASPPPFYTNYLHATYVTDTSGYHQLTGASWMNGSEIIIKGGDGADNQVYPSDIDTVGDAEGIFKYPDGDWGAIAYADDTYRVVYFAFGFEAIDNGEDRRDVMRRVLDYLGPCGPVPSEWAVYVPLLLAD